jgi:hypothetical protein
MVDRFRTRIGVALVAALALPACGQPLAPSPAAPREQPGIYAEAVVAELVGTSMAVEVRLRRVGVQTRVSSYQGRISFAADGLELVEAELPEGILGSWNEVAPGEIHFAGVALSGAAEGEILALRFATASGQTATGLEVALDEVTAAGTMEDVTAMVVSAI